MKPLSSDAWALLYEVADQVSMWDKLKLISCDDEELFIFCMRLTDYYELENC